MKTYFVITEDLKRAESFFLTSDNLLYVLL